MRAKLGSRLVLAGLAAALIGAPGCSRVPMTPRAYESANPSFVAVPTGADSTTADPSAKAPANSLAATFNSTSIPAGSTVWFSAVAKVASTDELVPVVVHVGKGTIEFSANGVPWSIDVPAGTIVLSPTAVESRTSFDGVSKSWTTTVPFHSTGSVFLTGVALPVPGGLPGDLNPVTWNARFSTSTPGVDVHWQWTAAPYRSFATDLGQLSIQAVDGGSIDGVPSADGAGTPENYKGEVVGGGMVSGPQNDVTALTAEMLTVPDLGLTGPLSGTGKIDGTAGGTLTVGRFTLIVPAGAWNGSATVGISIKDQSLLQCELSISPASANRFAQPVVLVSSFDGASAKDPAGLVTVWYDDNAKLWREVPGSESWVGVRQVKAPLWHFSSYGVTGGRAGW